MPHSVFFKGFNCTPLISGATLNNAALIMTKEILTVLNLILSCCHRAEEYRFIKLGNDTEEASKSYESSDNIRETGLVLLYIFALCGMGLNVGTVFSEVWFSYVLLSPCLHGLVRILRIYWHITIFFTTIEMTCCDTWKNYVFIKFINV